MASVGAAQKRPVRKLPDHPSQPVLVLGALQSDSRAKAQSEESKWLIFIGFVLGECSYARLPVSTLPSRARNVTESTFPAGSRPKVSIVS